MFSIFIDRINKRMRINDLTNNSQLDEGLLKDLHQRAIQQIIDWALPPIKRKEIEREVAAMTLDELKAVKRRIDNANIKDPADLPFRELFMYELVVKRLENPNKIAESKKKL